MQPARHMVAPLWGGRNRVQSTPNADQIAPYTAAGWVGAERHPSLPLTIYNYTHKCQFARQWDDVTRACRGLILADDGTVVARPFPKFFNLGEMDTELPDEPHVVYEKMDGSLFLVASYDGERVTSTRGSFVSQQAERGRAMLANHPNLRVPDGWTVCFEVIYPENRIVVDYGERAELVHLATIDNATGRTVPDRFSSFAAAARCDVDFRNPPERANAEGYVVHFTGPSDLRIKVKHAEYVRLHRLMTGVNSRTIWQCLMDGTGLDDIVAAVPDEFYGWVARTAAELHVAFERIRVECERVLQTVPTGDRKAAAAIITQSLYPSPTFAMMDAKDWRAAIWRMLKPEAARPFRIDADA